ncbi:MAG: hypothetical protein ACUVTL_08890 [Thermoproteota archaeon]
MLGSEELNEGKGAIKLFEVQNAVSVYLNASSLTPNLALKEIYEIVCGGNSRWLPSLAMTLDNFNRMNGVENLLWNISYLIESVGRVGLILISTSEFEIRNLVGGRLFSRLKPEFCEFQPYSAERLYEILELGIIQAYRKLIIDEEGQLAEGS